MFVFHADARDLNFFTNKTVEEDSVKERDYDN